MNPQTSLNQVPALFKQVDFSGKRVLDYGCGRFQKGAEYILDQEAVSYQGYDLHWYPVEPSYNRVDLAVCANVLNVITSWEERLQVYTDLLTQGIPEIHFSIYEGNRTSQPTASQNNEPVCFYQEELEQFVSYYNMPYEVTRKGKVLTLKLMSV